MGKRTDTYCAELRNIGRTDIADYLGVLVNERDAYAELIAELITFCASHEIDPANGFADLNTFSRWFVEHQTKAIEVMASHMAAHAKLLAG